MRLFLLKAVKNKAQRSKAQFLASGSGVLMVTRGTEAVCDRVCLCCGGRGRAPPPQPSASPPTVGLLLPGRGTPSPTFHWHPRPSVWHPGPTEHMLPVTAFHMCSQGLRIGVLRRRGRASKSAPVPVTDDIFMQENKTRISDGLHYLSRQLGATAAKQEVLCLDFKTVSGN